MKIKLPPKRKQRSRMTNEFKAMRLRQVMVVDMETAACIRAYWIRNGGDCAAMQNDDKIWIWRVK